MTGTFYKFAKKTNSTALPSGGALVPIEIKEESSIINPTILINQNDFPDYNFCYLGEFNRYYWIKEIIWENGIWRLECSVDVLGSYRQEIGNRQQYILRSSAEFDGNLFDNLYPAKANFTQEVIADSDFLWDDLYHNTGYYIIGLIGKWFENVEPQVGALTYTVMTPDVFRAFMNKLFSDDVNWAVPDWQEIGISESLAKMIFDPFQYIRSIRWVPDLRSDNIQDTQALLRLGFWYIETPSNPLSNYPFFVISRNIAIPKHPKSEERGNYLNSSKFTNYKLTLPLFGDVAIDPNELTSCNTIHITYILDLISGEAQCQIDASGQSVTRHRIKKIFGTYGVEIPLAQATTLFTDTVQPMTQATSFNPVSPGSSIANTITSFADLLSPPISYIGNYSGYMQTYNVIISLEGTFYDIADEYNTDNGRPLCKVRKPNELNGYMQIYNSDIEIDGTKEECERIKNYLEGGFFYE